MIKHLSLLSLLVLAVPVLAAPQKVLIVPDSGADRSVSFDPYDGHLLFASYLPDLKPFGGAGSLYTAKEIVWSPTGTFLVSDQAQDAVFEYSETGVYLRTLVGPANGLSNIRGIEVRNNRLYVTNADGALADTVQSFDLNGGTQTTYLSGNINSPWDVLFSGSDVLVSNSQGTDDITKFTLAGTPNGVFNSSLIQFVQQMQRETNGNILAAGFSGGGNSGVYEFSPSGVQLGFWAPASGARGVYRLGNGKILYTHGTQISIVDPITGLTSLVATGQSFQYISLVTWVRRS